MKAEIISKSYPDGYCVTLRFIRSRNQRRYPGIGKSWPVTTQCLLDVNGTIKSVGTVVLHDKDKDCPNLGARLAAKKALTNGLAHKGTRRDLWELINKKFTHKKEEQNATR